MSTEVLERPEARAAPSPSPEARVARFIRVEARENATHVTRFGGKVPLYLKVLDSDVMVGEIRQYCIEQCAWKIQGVPVSVDGVHHDMPDADEVVLSSTTRNLEFRQKTSGHG